jgi:TfoX/Sxy family transcriptional regulator of competence genes
MCRIPDFAATLAPMAYDEQMAERIRAALADRGDVSERKMMGGLVFMVGDHMACGARRDGSLLARVGPEGMDDALDQPGVEPMVMRERVMKGYVYVEGDAVADDAALRAWVERCVAFVQTLPPK